MRILCLQVEAVNNVEAGLMQDAQRFFVLTQTDNLWKEHLQAIKFLQQVSPAVNMMSCMKPALMSCS